MDITKLTNFFNQLGLNDDLTKNAISLIQGEEVEDFDLPGIAERYANEKEELFLSRNKAAIIDKYEKETHNSKWAEFSNPLLNTIKKAGGFSREDLADLTVKEAINKLVKQKELEGSKNGDEATAEYRQKVTGLQTELEELRDLAARLETEKGEVEEAANKRIEATIYAQNAKQVLKARLYSKDIGFDIPEKVGLYIQLIEPKILDSYLVGQDGSITAKDGTKALSFDGKTFYTHVDQAIKDLAKGMNILKVSNGGITAKTPILGKTAGGEKVNLVGTNFLAQQLAKK